jgi:branched-chain amino acid transport system permease protein
MTALRRNRGMLVTLIIIFALVALMAGRYEPKVAASVLLSGLTLGALYFLVTSGLSLIFGLMDVLNFAHGLLFMLGAYIGYTMYANPRMLLNTLPLAFVLVGGSIVGTALAKLVWKRIGNVSIPIERGVLIGLWIGAIGLAIVGFGGLDLIALASSAATVAGGAISTTQAQATGSTFFGQLIALVLAGILIGAATYTRQRHHSIERTTNKARRNLILAVIFIVVAFIITPLRLPGEQFLLSWSSNARFVLALIVGALSGAAVGALIEWGLIRPLYVRPIYQVLVTLGLVYVGTEVVKSIWGPAGFYMDIPDLFNGGGPNCPSPDLLSWFTNNCASIDVLGRPFPSYRMFIILLGVIVFVAVGLLLRRTRLGMIIRAGVQDSDMVQALGINVRRVFTLVFALGAGLAALGGVAAAPFLGVNLGIGQELLIQGFIAVVIGGMGSYPGAAMGALLVGLARAFGDQLVLSGVQLPGMDTAIKFSPSIARASTVLIMALVLLIRPTGLFGKKE